RDHERAPRTGTNGTTHSSRRHRNQALTSHRCRRPEPPTALQRKEPAAMHPTHTLPTNGANPDRATRRVDGKPETQADRLFFDLRESGYLGPIDQDGNAVAELAIPPVVVAELATTPAGATDAVTPAVTLRAAALY